MSARDVVTATIKQEHYALGMVMAVLQRLLGDIAERRGGADFGPVATAL